MRRVLIVLPVVLVTASYVAYARYGNAEGTVQLATARVRRGDVVQSIDATGRLEAVTTVQVGSQISGTIKELYADFNSRVTRGQVIARLEPSLLETQVEQAEASVVRLQADADRSRVQLEDAQVKLARAHELAAQQLVPRADVETAEANAKVADAAYKAAQAQVTQAQASLDQSKVNLNHTVITAPIDGVVVSRNVDVGQTVAASIQAPTLFQIANDLSHMQVNASVDEADIGRVTSGQPVTFRVDAYPDETFSGTVRQVRLGPVIESNVVSYVTVIDVPNDDLRLKPGMTATVSIEVARANGALMVPASALRFSPTPEVFEALGRKAPPAPVARAAGGIWVVGDGGLRAVPVQAGISNGADVAIVAGELQEGAVVATGVIQANAAGTTVASGSPLLPQFGRRVGSNVQRGASGNQAAGARGGR